MIRFALQKIIKFYQKFLRKIINRRCVYRISCSNHAYKLLNNSSLTTIEILFKIKTRVSSCGVTSITVSRNLYDTQVRNRHQELIEIDDLALHVLDRVKFDCKQLNKEPKIKMSLDEHDKYG
jgi:putative component of membrane protein insertase Oxa1/YidC/SpoIIIJ protein YidD